jgi:hypothetical protein
VKEMVGSSYKLVMNMDFKVSRYYVLECYFMDRIRLRVVS